MWFSKKKVPKTTIDDLKSSFEKIDFNSEKELSSKLTYFMRVMGTFNESRAKLDKKIKAVADKSEQHLKDKETLREIEIKAAEELNSISDKDISIEVRSRVRKLTAALHSAQLKLSNFDRIAIDYINTEKVLSSLYIDLEDCRNILEYMISSLDRNLERVRATNFFTFCPEEVEDSEDDTTYESSVYIEISKKSKFYTSNYGDIPTVSGSSYPTAPTTKIIRQGKVQERGAKELKQVITECERIAKEGV